MPLARASKRALEELGDDSERALGPRESLDRSAEQLFGKELLERLDDVMTAALEHARTESDEEIRKLALEYLAPGCSRALSAAMVAVDGCFEVGARLAPVRAREIEELVRVVDHPTREMLLTLARSPSDLLAAVIEDPRRVVLDLAAGRLLSKKFIEREERTVERTRLAGEVRVYLLDGSSSMIDGSPGGARARMRDAVLLAELATMMRRLDTPGRRMRLALFYRFFTKRLAPVVEVRTGKQVLAAMADIVGRARTGGTDIEAALLSSFALIADAKRTDPDLARANIVLITDGEAAVDPEKIHLARESAGDVAIGVSVIALGQENPVLRELVARQRARGERAFYHYLDDATLTALAAGELATRSVHFSLDDAPELATQELEVALQEIDDLAGDRRATATTPAEGERAHEEASTRDRFAIERRFARWFPPPKQGATTAPTEVRVSDQLSGDLHAVTVLLAAIAETVGDLGADPLHRKADAIDLLERMLPDARISPGRYFDLLAAAPATLAGPLAAVHRASRGAEAYFDAKLGASERGRAH
ncbi:MAG: vWA domain-containing protein [Polyangiaceae bacterium]